MLVAFAFYISYFVMALPAAAILKRTGLKNGMMLGFFCNGSWRAGFIPAAINRTYEIFLAGLFIQATGLTILQTASNPYITILGPIESAASRISIMGICNKAAGAIAPLILINAITKTRKKSTLFKKATTHFVCGRSGLVAERTFLEADCPLYYNGHCVDWPWFNDQTGALA